MVPQPVPAPEQPDRLHHAAEGVIGHIQAQLQARHYGVDDIPEILDRVNSYVQEFYRPQPKRQPAENIT